jgi:preprotein translocase subunit SecD
MLRISKTLRVFFLIVFLTVVAVLIAMPEESVIPVRIGNLNREVVLKRPSLHFPLLGRDITNDIELKEGLDIQGGMQLVLQADMSKIAPDDRENALAASKDIIQRRVDLFGVSEPVVQTLHSGDDYRIQVELAGVKDPDQALQLVGTTAELDFRLQAASPSAEATESAVAFLSQFEPTGLTGKDLKRSSVQFDQQNGSPVVAMEFNDEGRKKFASITENNINRVLAIFLDGLPVTAPRINSAIYDGQAIITGQFSVEEAKQLSIQLNAGALPVPIQIIGQQTIGATLGQQSVQQSVRAGVVGLLLVITFMILSYGWKGLLADMSLLIYAVFTIAVYKLIGITLTLPGIAGLLLTIGMAVDANILIFERMKEELRSGKSFQQSMELGFGRAWNSIKDANLTTIFIALVLINPADFPFLSTSGLVRGFGLTLLIGVLISLFTSMVITKTFMRLFLRGTDV